MRFKKAEGPSPALGQLPAKLQVWGSVSGKVSGKRTLGLVNSG